MVSFILFSLVSFVVSLAWIVVKREKMEFAESICVILWFATVICQTVAVVEFYLPGTVLSDATSDPAARDMFVFLMTMLTIAFVGDSYIWNRLKKEV